MGTFLQVLLPFPQTSSFHSLPKVLKHIGPQMIVCDSQLDIFHSKEAPKARHQLCAEICFLCLLLLESLPPPSCQRPRLTSHLGSCFFPLRRSRSRASHLISYLFQEQWLSSPLHCLLPVSPSNCSQIQRKSCLAYKIQFRRKPSKSLTCFITIHVIIEMLQVSLLPDFPVKQFIITANINGVFAVRWASCQALYMPCLN